MKVGSFYAGSEAMFADLGHFSYTAIQVLLGYYQSTSIFCSGNVRFCQWSPSLCFILVADCLHLSSLSSSHIGIHGSGCLPLQASSHPKPNQFLPLSSRYSPPSSSELEFDTRNQITVHYLPDCRRSLDTDTWFEQSFHFSIKLVMIMSRKWRECSLYCSV